MRARGRRCGFVEIGDAPITVAGRYGTLTVNEVGDYTYHPSTTLGYSATDLVDNFTYQLVQPNGTLATALVLLLSMVEGVVEGAGEEAVAAARRSIDLALDGVFRMRKL